MRVWCNAPGRWWAYCPACEDMRCADTWTVSMAWVGLHLTWHSLYRPE